jgi:hypothetical protein
MSSAAQYVSPSASRQTLGGRGVITDIPARLDRLPWSRFHLLVTVALGGTVAPALFGHLIETGSSWALAGGYMFAASLMLAAAVAEAGFGIDAEMRSLERIADPLSSE